MIEWVAIGGAFLVASLALAIGLYVLRVMRHYSD